jgi:patatin-like phospholipase/acyl hydrolase
LTLEFLVELEKQLREKLKLGEDFVLADYFDLIAGTSTGAIIATALALGMPVKDVRRFYHECGQEIFTKSHFLKWFKYLYPKEKVTAKLQEVYKAETLGSDQLRCLVLIVMRNADTNSHWPLTNNPLAKYNDRSRKDCNLNLPLWQLVRASTAAPVYFPAEEIQVGHQKFKFVDGGTTTFNNPGFLAFVMATTAPYRIDWESGADKMLLVSVGTGHNPKIEKSRTMNVVTNLISFPGNFMFAAFQEQDLLCRVFGDCRVGYEIDREVGTLIGSKGPVTPKLFTYLRYDAELSEEGLTALGLSGLDPKSVTPLDCVEAMEDLQQIGRALAEKKLSMDDFKGFV